MMYRYSLMIPADENGLDYSVEYGYIRGMFEGYPQFFHLARDLMNTDYEELTPNWFDAEIDGKDYLLVRYNYTDFDLQKPKGDRLFQLACDALHQGNIWDFSITTDEGEVLVIRNIKKISVEEMARIWQLERKRRGEDTDDEEEEQEEEQEEVDEED
jgi:hypothetical protein